MIPFRIYNGFFDDKNQSMPQWAEIRVALRKFFLAEEGQESYLFLAYAGHATS